MSKYYFVFVRSQPLHGFYYTVEAENEEGALKQKNIFFPTLEAYIHDEKSWNQYGEPLSKLYGYKELENV